MNGATAQMRNPLAWVRTPNFLILENTMKLKRVTAQILIAASVAVPTQIFAATTFFDDRAMFEAAISGLTVTEDPFDNLIAGDVEIIFDSGVVSTNDQASGSPNDNAVISFGGAGVFQNSLSNAFDSRPTINVWTFPTAVTAFGFEQRDADIPGAAVVIGSGEGAQTFSLRPDFLVPITEFRFFGLVFDAPITEVTFFDQNALGTDTYRIDNLVFATDVAPVPLPATLSFLIAGLGGLAVLRRRQKSASAAG